MPNRSFLILRVVVTLSCLVGVPAVALMGIRSAEPTATRRIEPAAGRTGAPPAVADTNAEATPYATDDIAIDRTIGGAKPTPKATIRDVAVVPAPGDALTRQFERLRELGATYHRLESSPRAATEFRFHCRVAGFARHFEAVDPVASNAVGRVLREVEAALRNSATDSTTDSATNSATADPPTSVYRR